ncbi:MAG: hypothetical protein HC898_10105 [Phycisphaerales bacterium]|nr:hypothetical protein [Phycisphaerales bacterium]
MSENIKAGAVSHRRLTTQMHIDQSGLPSQAADVVQRVVRRTRLWPREREDVTRELIAHFADGLEAGASVDQLIRDFGDPEKAARLIRRAKKRNRPWWWHTQERLGQLLLVLVAVYLGLWVWLMTGKPQPSVDYIAQLNAAAMAVPSDQAAWPIYREAAIAYKLNQFDTSPLYVKEADKRLHLARPDDSQWSAMVAYLDRHAELIDMIHQGAARPGLGFIAGHDMDITQRDRLAFYGEEQATVIEQPTEDRSYAQQLAEESLIGVLLPHLGMMRKMAELMVADMRLAAVAGDGARIVKDMESIIGLARHAREIPLVVNDLVGVSILSMGLREVSDILHHRKQSLDVAQWIQIAHLLASIDPLMQVRFEGERMFMYDTLQRVYAPNGQITSEGMKYLLHLDQLIVTTNHNDASYQQLSMSMGLPLVYIVMADRGQMQTKYDHYMDLTAKRAVKPFWQQLSEPSESKLFVDQLMSSNLGFVRYWPVVVLAPALDGVSGTMANLIALRDAVQVAIALELYQRELKQYPDTLGQLVPRYLPTMPVDHSTGKELLYRMVDGQPMLYGRGLDGDDDGGLMSKKALRALASDKPG